MIDIFLYVENAGSVQFNSFIKQKIVDRLNKMIDPFSYLKILLYICNMEYTQNLNETECDKQWNELLDDIRITRDLQSRYGDVTLSEVRSYIAKDLQKFINDHPYFLIR